MKNWLSFLSAAVTLLSALLALYSVSIDLDSSFISDLVKSLSSLFGSTGIATAMIASAITALVGVLFKFVITSRELKMLEVRTNSARAKLRSLEGKEPQVFISYAHEDIDRVSRVIEELEENGFKVWVDRLELKPGDNLVDGINSAIHASDYVLFVFTQSSVDRGGYLQSELRLALDASRKETKPLKVLPILLDKVAIPSDVSNLRYVDATGPNGIEKVSRTILDMQQVGNVQ